MHIKYDIIRFVSDEMVLGIPDNLSPIKTRCDHREFGFPMTGASDDWSAWSAATEPDKSPIMYTNTSPDSVSSESSSVSCFDHTLFYTWLYINAFLWCGLATLVFLAKRHTKLLQDINTDTY